MSKLFVNELHPKTSGSFVDVAKPVLCKIYTPSNFAVGASSYTEVPFNTSDFDTHGLADLSNNGITIPSGMGGYYHIKGRIRAPMTTQRIVVQFFINGSADEFFEQAGYTDNVGQLGVVEADTILVLNDADTLTLQTYHDYSSSRNFIGGIDSCNMLVHRIGAS
tara:strand:+ start:3447 stop:3938 length:492 start_codon:yes stop_codon:yes gene_type:complete